MDSTTHDLSHVLIELGLVVIGLAILARIASRWGFSAIPLSACWPRFWQWRTVATEGECWLYPYRAESACSCFCSC